MAKNIKWTMVCAAIALMCASCQKNPLDEVEAGNWNKEKRLLALTFEGQAGEAAISVNLDDITKGTAQVTVVNPQVEKGIRLTGLEVSYKATASVKVGDLVAFDPQQMTTRITVTGADRKTREYEVRLTPLNEDLVGKWNIHSLDVFGGTGPYYGGVDFVNMLHDTSWWDSQTGVAAELDNELEFVFEGVNEKGQTFGKCIHAPGADGLFADFTWKGDLPDDQSVRDVNTNYRRIPAGEITWLRDYSQQTLTLTQNGKSHTASIVEKGNIEYWGKHLVIEDKAIKFTNLDKLGNWGPIYTVYDKLIYMPWDYYVQIRKK